MNHSISHNSKTPTSGTQVITACAFIHANIDGIEKVFLPKRADTKKFLPGVFELPGGHIEFGEDMVDGLKREIQEEFEVEIRVGDPFYVFTYLNEVKNSHSVEVVYFATLVDPIENIKLHPEDHSEYTWIAEDELHKVVADNKQEEDQEFLAIRKGFEVLKEKSMGHS